MSPNKGYARNESRGPASGPRGRAEPSYGVYSRAAFARSQPGRPRQIHPCVFLSPLVFSVDRYFTLGLNSPEIISLPTSIFRHPKFVRGCEPKFGVAPKFGGGGAPLARKFRVAKNLGARRFCARSTAPPPYLPHQSAANKGPTAYLPHFRGDKKTQGWICREPCNSMT